MSTNSANVEHSFVSDTTHTTITSTTTATTTTIPAGQPPAPSSGGGGACGGCWSTAESSTTPIEQRNPPPTPRSPPPPCKSTTYRSSTSRIRSGTTTTPATHPHLSPAPTHMPLLLITFGVWSLFAGDLCATVNGEYYTPLLYTFIISDLRAIWRCVYETSGEGG